jgi:hypothetical protein
VAVRDGYWMGRIYGGRPTQLSVENIRVLIIQMFNAMLYGILLLVLL